MWKPIILSAIFPMLLVGCAARQDGPDERPNAEKQVVAEVLLVNEIGSVLEYKHATFTQTSTDRGLQDRNVQSSLSFNLDWSTLAVSEKTRLRIPKGTDLTLRYKLDGTERELSLRIDKSQKLTLTPAGPESTPLEAADGPPEIRFGS